MSLAGVSQECGLISLEAGQGDSNRWKTILKGWSQKRKEEEKTWAEKSTHDGKQPVGCEGDLAVTSVTPLIASVAKQPVRELWSN
jgi:hypothetical protein